MATQVDRLESGAVFENAGPGRARLEAMAMGEGVDADGRPGLILWARLQESRSLANCRRTFHVLAFFVMPLGIAGITGALFYFVSRATQPNVWWQSVQVLHVAHFLWPAWLFLYRYHWIARQSRAWLEGFATAIEVSD